MSESNYRSAVNSVALECAQASNPDRAFHAMMSNMQFNREHFRDVMNYSEHPSAWADLMGDAVESFTADHWEAVVDQITYMSFRADVLERVASIKGGN